MINSDIAYHGYRNQLFAHLYNKTNCDSHCTTCLNLLVDQKEIIPSVQSFMGNCENLLLQLKPASSECRLTS